MFALEAEALTAEAVIPSGAEFSALATRPILVAGDAPLPAVILLEMTARGVGVAAVAEPSALVAADTLGADVAVTRAHTANTATALMQATETTWAEVGQNLPRYAHLSRALRVDGVGSNSIRNPRGAGAVAPSTLPTHWSVGGGGTGSNGLTLTIVGTGADSGIDYVTIEIAGTSTATTGSALNFEATTALPVVAGEAWSGSFFYMQEPGFPHATAGLTITHRLYAVSGSPADHTGSTVTPGAAWQRVSVSRTMPTGATFLLSRLRYSATVASVISTRIRLGVAQVAQATPPAPLLPAVGALAATSTAADVPIWTPATFPRRGCIVIRGAYDAAAGASVLGLLQIDGGADTNRIVARIIAGGLQPEALVVSGGATAATLTPAGSFVAGAPCAALLAWSPGGVRFGTSAGGVVSAAVAMPSGLTRAVLGHANAAGTLPMSGALTADFYPAWPSVAEAFALLAS
jgi:hypothetical protein